MKKMRLRQISAILVAAVLMISCAKNDINYKSQSMETTRNASQDKKTDDFEKNEARQDVTENSIKIPDIDVNSLVTTGGMPWLNTDLKENVNGRSKPSIKNDFHFYTNYEWLSEKEIAAGSRSASPLGVVQQTTDMRAKDLLTDTTLSGHDAELVQTMYRTMLNWNTRDALGMEPVRETVEKVEGITTMDELSEFLCDPKESEDVPFPISIHIDIGLKDASKYVTMIDVAGFLLEDSAEYENRTAQGKSFEDAYRRETQALLTRLGYTTDEADKMYENTLKTEAMLAKNACTMAEKYDPSYIEKINNPYTFAEIKNEMQNFPITKWIKGYGYGKSKEFLVTEPKYLHALDALYSKEHMEEIKDMLIVKYVLAEACYLDKAAYQADIDAKNEIAGITGKKADEKVAFDEIRDKLTVPMDRLFVEKYGSKQTKEKITALCQHLIDESKEMIREEDWLSEETRKAATEKLNAMKIHAVYPEQWEDYSKLSLDDKDLVAMEKEIAAYKRKLDCQKINKSVNNEIWDNDILEANAYYNLQTNTIIIGMGILGDPIYNDKMSTEQIYGGIGAFISHEISHAFDTNGAQFDANGSYRDWWTANDYRAFKDRADKLVKYYDDIKTFSDVNVIGANIQTEAIADIAGMKVMLQLADKQADFDYDTFFTQYAMNWKMLNTKEFEVYILTRDPHPLAYLRTNVTLQQFDEFNKTYEITEGDDMYLPKEDRICVW